MGGPCGSTLHSMNLGEAIFQRECSRNCFGSHRSSLIGFGQKLTNLICVKPNICSELFVFWRPIIQSWQWQPCSIPTGWPLELTCGKLSGKLPTLEMRICPLSCNFTSLFVHCPSYFRSGSLSSHDRQWQSMQDVGRWQGLLYSRTTSLQSQVVFGEIQWSWCVIWSGCLHPTWSGVLDESLWVMAQFAHIKGIPFLSIALRLEGCCW